MRVSDAAADAVNGIAASIGEKTRPAAATHVLAGTMPAPLLSSLARGWNGITVELHSFHDLDAVVQASDHVIAVHLA